MLLEHRRRADGALREIAAAVRANAVEPMLNALRAERAFERADHRVRGIGWKIFVAAFATGSELEHVWTSC
jgi:hypothetical protein